MSSISPSSSHRETIEAQPAGCLSQVRPFDSTPCAFCGYTSWNRGNSHGMHFVTFPCTLAESEDSRIFVHFAELVLAISTKMTFNGKRITQNFDQKIKRFYPSELRNEILAKFLKSNIKDEMPKAKQQALLDTFLGSKRSISALRRKEAIPAFQQIYNPIKPSNSSSSSTLASSEPESSSSNPEDLELVFDPSPLSVLSVSNPPSSSSSSRDLNGEPFNKRARLSSTNVSVSGEFSHQIIATPNGRYLQIDIKSQAYFIGIRVILAQIPSEELTQELRDKSLLEFGPSSSSSSRGLNGESLEKRARFLPTNVSVSNESSYGVIETSYGRRLQFDAGSQTYLIDIRSILAQIPSDELTQELSRRS